MLDQYPHTLKFLSDGVTPDVWDDVNGGYIIGTQGSEVSLKCRAVPSGTSGPGSVIKNEDGQDVIYAFDLVFPFDTIPVPQWRQVTITDVNGEVLISDKLKRYQRGQMLHHRGWI